MGQTDVATDTETHTQTQTGIIVCLTDIYKVKERRRQII